MRAVLLALLAAAQAPATDEGAVETRTIPARSENGRLQVLAVESREPVIIDGVLDDSAWRLAPPVSGFIQAEPYEGKPATEDTEVRVAFDSKNLYIAAICHDRGRSGVVVNDIREDFPTGEQDSFEIILDTLYDHRNGFVFMTNPEGARADQQMANEGREVNASWDAVWFVGTSRSEEGWSAGSVRARARSADLRPGITWRRTGIHTFMPLVTRRVLLDDGAWLPIPFVDSHKAELLFRHKVLGLLRDRDLIRSGRKVDPKERAFERFDVADRFVDSSRLTFSVRVNRADDYARVPGARGVQPDELPTVQWTARLCSTAKSRTFSSVIARLACPASWAVNASCPSLRSSSTTSKGKFSSAYKDAKV